MERVFPFLADTSGPYKQLLAAEQTARTVQALIQEKKDARRAIKQQAVDQCLPYDATYGQIKLLEDDIVAFKLLLKSNEASRSQWREMHMAAWRATVRPLKVVDMPKEILQAIFANFKDVPVPQIQIDSPPLDDALPSPDLANIKNIRLACRTFSKVGSEILLPVVDVWFTPSSLQRLEDISNHLSLSRSVRILRIHANPYHPLLANDSAQFQIITQCKLRSLHCAFEDFVRKTQKEMAEACHLVGVDPEPELLRINRREFDLLETEFRRMVSVLREIGDTRDGSPPGDFEAKIREAIDQSHEEYRRRYLEQQSLLQDYHVHANITAAVRKMPLIKQLCIIELAESLYNWNKCITFMSGWGIRFDAQRYKTLMSGPNPFWDLMVQTRDRDALPVSLGSQRRLEFSLLDKLPLVLQAANSNLTRLYINFPPVLSCHMEALAAHIPNIRRACGNLKFVEVVQIACGDRGELRASLPVTYSLLKALLVSPQLEVVKLRLKHVIPPNFEHPTPSIGPVLVKLPWEKLRSVCLESFPVKVEELRQAVEKLPGKTHLELRGVHLVEGTWAEALEILRGRADCSSRVVHPRGVEMKNMSRPRFQSLLCEFDGELRNRWYSDQRCPGPASFYIRGGNIPNPLIWGDE